MALEEGDDTLEEVNKLKRHCKQQAYVNLDQILVYTFLQIDVDIASAITEGRVNNNSLFNQPNSIYQLSAFTDNDELEMLLDQE